MRKTSNEYSEVPLRASRYYAIAIVLVVVAAIIIYFFHPQGTKSYATPRLVFLYATCSLNKNYLEPYNSSVRYTPNLEHFASDSVVFLRHQTESSFSGAAYAGLLSGQPVYRHGIYYHPKPLKSDLYMIGEAFHDHGFDVVYLNGHEMATESLNYAQGFPHENVVSWAKGDEEAIHNRDAAIRSVLYELRKDPKRKALIIMNFSVTHAPYTRNSTIPATESFCRKFANECEGITTADFNQYVPLYERNHVNLQLHFQETIHSMALTPDQVNKMAKVIEATYKSSVYLLDKNFGKMIKQITDAHLLDESLVTFTSDHGEVLYRPGADIAWTHSCPHKCLEPESLNIALLIRLPYARAAGKYEEVTRAMDVYPTLTALSGLNLATEKQVTGKDLSSAILGKSPRADLPAFACGELVHPSVQPDDPHNLDVGLRIQDNFYILHAMPLGSSTMSIMDLRNYTIAEPSPNDPNSARARMLLLEYKEQIVKHYTIENDQQNWNEQLEKLRSLGYVN